MASILVQKETFEDSINDIDNKIELKEAIVDFNKKEILGIVKKKYTSPHGLVAFENDNIKIRLYDQLHY